MQVHFQKYHALGNDFLVIDSVLNRLGVRRMPRLAIQMCDRRRGVGADGILFVTTSQKGDARVEVYNSDGSWAEKSGNGLRIVGLYLTRNRSSRTRFVIEMGGQVHKVSIMGRSERRVVSTELGSPDFHAKNVPVKSRSQFHINKSLKVGGLDFAITCLSVGNPHAVLFADSFDFDWHALGQDIEHHPAFPERANVEFVRVMNRELIEVCDWERGAGATGSSGTGASAAVCAGVILGVIDRRCTVRFPGGAIDVNWRESDNKIEIAGPVAFVASGDYDFK